MVEMNDQTIRDKTVERKTKKRVYRSPVFTKYEDLRTLTLGSSKIGTESGGPTPADFRVS